MSSVGYAWRRSTEFGRKEILHIIGAASIIPAGLDNECYDQGGWGSTQIRIKKREKRIRSVPLHPPPQP
jgi:hypothetical protein